MKVGFAFIITKFIFLEGWSRGLIHGMSKSLFYSLERMKLFGIRSAQTVSSVPKFDRNKKRLFLRLLLSPLDSFIMFLWSISILFRPLWLSINVRLFLGPIRFTFPFQRESVRTSLSKLNGVEDL